MKIRYDSEANAVYLKLKDVEIDHTKEVEENGDVIIDYDKEGNVIGVELLFVKEKNPELLNKLHVENLVVA